MLNTSEIQRIKRELGVNLLAVGAEPYIGVALLFEQVIQPHTLAGAQTTCATTVTAQRVSTPVDLTLLSSAGFAAFDRVVVDVDDYLEVATVRAVVGNIINVFLKLAHTGTYTVMVEGGESLIREALVKLIALGKKIALAVARAGLKRVDEIEFYGGPGSMWNQTPLGALWKLRELERRELADMLGVPYIRAGKQGGVTTVTY